MNREDTLLTALLARPRWFRLTLGATRKGDKSDFYEKVGYVAWWCRKNRENWTVNENKMEEV